MKPTLLAAGLFAIGTLTALGAARVDVSGRDHRFLNPEGRSDSVPYSHAVQAGDTLYVAGTLGIDSSTGAPPEDVREEVRLVMDGIVAKLALGGMTTADLVSIQVFCPDLTLYDAFNEVYRTYFEGGFPARAFIGSGPLLRGARFEVAGVAVRRGPR